MDYLVFGTGMGATLVLVGLAGRAFGPSLRYRTPSRSADVLRAEQLVARIAWARFCSSLGASLALAGGFLLLVTALLMIVHVNDSVGTISILVALLAVVLLMAFWSWAFVQRFGLLGIVQPKSRETQSETESDTYLDSDAAPLTTMPAAPARAPQTAAAPVTSRPEQPVTSRPPTPLPTTHQPLATPAPVATPTGAPDTPTTTPAMPPVPATASAIPTTTTEGPKRTPTPSLMRRPGVVVTPTTTPLPPMVTHADASRSEIVNPSDAAALDRILSGGDEPTTPGSLFDDLPAVDDDDLQVHDDKPPNG